MELNHQLTLDDKAEDDDVLEVSNSNDRLIQLDALSVIAKVLEEGLIKKSSRHMTKRKE
jgi:hypothetical protein